MLVSSYPKACADLRQQKLKKEEWICGEPGKKNKPTKRNSKPAVFV
jgi:hypothetical protein